MMITIKRYLFALLVLTMFSQASFAQTSLTSGVTNAGYSLNTAAQAVDPGLAITSFSNITGFIVTISSGLKSSDVRSYTGTLPIGITVTAYNSSTLNLCLQSLRLIPSHLQFQLRILFVLVEKEVLVLTQQVEQEC